MLCYHPCDIIQTIHLSYTYVSQAKVYVVGRLQAVGCRLYVGCRQNKRGGEKRRRKKLPEIHQGHARISFFSPPHLKKVRMNQKPERCGHRLVDIRKTTFKKIYNFGLLSFGDPPTTFFFLPNLDCLVSFRFDLFRSVQGAY